MNGLGVLRLKLLNVQNLFFLSWRLIHQVPLVFLLYDSG